MPVIECDVAAAREKLASAGAEISDGNNDYEHWRAEYEEAVAVAYDDKVVVQGKRPAAIVAVLRGAQRTSGQANGPGSRGGGRAHLYFDGASRGNPGPAAIGWVIVTSDGILAEGSERIGRTTNNQAEYEALIAVLRAARDYSFDRVEIRGDSQLVVKQVTGAWNTNDPELRERRVTVRELLSDFGSWSLSHVPREINERADNLANEALDDG